MIRITAAFLIVLGFCFPTQARHHHITHIINKDSTGCVFKNSGRTICIGSIQHIHDHPRVTDASGNNPQIIGGRPSGCPRAFCGCEASRYVFGKIIPDLNLAYNWIRKFPRALPAPGMAAARNHHVMILISHASGSDWLVHDGNGGRHKIWEHVRSIIGYRIVDPHGGKYASR